MDKISVPYKIETLVATFQGDWTAEEIDKGLADASRVEEYHAQWYEPSANGHVEVTDPERIRVLEESIRK